MHLIRLDDAPFVERDLETRRYYTPDRDPIEIIETIMGSNASQSAHSHATVREAMLVLEGAVLVEEIISGKSFGQTIGAGDFVVFDRAALHRMENKSEKQARTLHFKFLGDGKDRALFLNDKSESEVTQLPISVVPNLESRYSSYVETHSSLDNLLWQIPMFLVTVSAFGATLMGTFISKDDSSIPPFTHTQTLGLLFFLWGVMYLLGCYAMDQIRYHHSLAATVIARLDPGGYFEKRIKSISRIWPIGDAELIKAVFAGFGISLLCWSVLVFQL